MVYSRSREHKRAALCEKLQLLRSVTNSHAVNNSSIILDASKYIEELKQKVERLNQDINITDQTTTIAAAAQTSAHHHLHPLPKVKVEALEKGFLVNVFSKKSCPGLLVFILEAFEELGLSVLEARVTCTDTFRLEAVNINGGDNDQAEQAVASSSSSSIDSHVVKQAVLQAIRNWTESAAIST